MLQILLSELQRYHHESILAFYGDHLPSLPHAFRHFGFDEWDSDYVVWQDTRSPARQLDLVAHRLPTIILDALLQRGMIDRRGAAALVPQS
jgi:hypothetical protein